LKLRCRDVSCEFDHVETLRKTSTGLKHYGKLVETWAADVETLRKPSTGLKRRPARDLADDTGYSLSTIYRALQRLDGLVASDNGHVEFVSEKLRQEVREIVATVDKGIDNAAERVGRLVDMEVYQTASSAFERWLAKYGAEFIPPAENGRADTSPVVRIDTVLSEIKSSNQPLLSDVLGEMLDAWGSDGRDRSVLRGALLKANVDGEGIVGSVAANL